jgi:putative oxidoreductase
MAMLEKVLLLTDRVRAALERTQWLPQLLVRVFLGYFFFETGMGKIKNIDTFIERFTGWGIPAPAFNAHLAAYTECVGGVLVLLGLATRLISIPMVINMAVAVISVKAKNAESITDYFEMDEPLYALGFLWLIFSGPGKVSLDAVIDWVVKRRVSSPASK